MKNEKKRKIAQTCPTLIKVMNNLGTGLVKVAIYAIIKPVKKTRITIYKEMRPFMRHFVCLTREFYARVL